LVFYSSTILQTLCTFGKDTLRRIYGPTQDTGRWRSRWNSAICNLYRDLNILDDIKIRRVGWEGQVERMKDERILKKKVLNGIFHNTRTVGKPRTRWQDVVRRDTSQMLVTREEQKTGKNGRIFGGRPGPRRGLSALDGLLLLLLLLSLLVVLQI